VNEASLAVDEYRSLRQQEAITLAILLGLDPTEEIRVISGFSTPILPRTPAETIDRPELVAADARITQSHAAIGGARAGYFPTISVFGGYSVGKPNRDMFNADWDDYFTVGARASWSFNLGNRTGDEVALAEYDLAMAQQTEQQTRDDLTREAALAFAQWQLTARRYFTSEDRVEIAAANYRLAQAQHEAGALPTNRLLEIERNLSRAEAALAVTLVDYHLAHARYSYASGTDSF
jgi:outer membrane protein TolC